MIVAEFEIYHSRPIAPTRRIALGTRDLPIRPAPGAGGVLLAGIMAQAAPMVEPELREPVFNLLEDLASGRRVPQPRVRHRFQSDRIGLLRSTHRLVAVGETLEFEFDFERGRAVQFALGALYGAAGLPADVRRPVFDALRRALLWGGAVDGRFIAEVMGGRGATLRDLVAWNNPVAWALDILDLEAEDGETPTNRAVQRRFRSLLREAHPDHGGGEREAAQRIAELTEARRILLTR